MRGANVTSVSFIAPAFCPRPAHAHTRTHARVHTTSRTRAHTHKYTHRLIPDSASVGAVSPSHAPRVGGCGGGFHDVHLLYPHILRGEHCTPCGASIDFGMGDTFGRFQLHCRRLSPSLRTTLFGCFATQSQVVIKTVEESTTKRNWTFRILGPVPAALGWFAGPARPRVGGSSRSGSMGLSSSGLLHRLECPRVRERGPCTWGQDVVCACHEPPKDTIALVWVRPPGGPCGGRRGIGVRSPSVHFWCSTHGGGGGG